MKSSSAALARKHLEARLAPLRDSTIRARPPKGWVRALRDALGMTASELGRRIGVSQAQATQFEQGEVDGSITLRSLRGAAEAMDCELVYALVPRTPIDEMLRSEAVKLADRQLRITHHTMALENQAMRGADQESERERLIAALLDDPRRIWRAE
jgi:predicted DNA-binding mobile mystery protein A